MHVYDMSVGGTKIKREVEDGYTVIEEEAQAGEIVNTTTEDVMTMDDNKRALELRNFHRTLGHPSDSVLSAAIRAGTYAEKLFRARDVENARRLLRPCEFCTERCMVRPAEITNDSILPHHIGHT